MHNRFLVVCCLLACVILGCKQSKPPVDDVRSYEEESVDMPDEQTEEEEIDELISEEPMPLAAEELFDDFFFNFASNKKLQAERIHFPLVVSSEAKSDTLESAEWQTDHFFMREEEYTLIFDNEEQMEQVKDTGIDRVVVEKIFLDQGFVNQYQFGKENGRWMLDSVHKQTLSLNPNASFLSFYRRFVTDSVYQQKSLNEEIKFAGPDPDDDFNQMEGVITPDFWEAFAPELPKGIIYNIVYGRQKADSNLKIFVLRGIANGLEVEMTFKRDGNQWKLIKLTE